MTVVREIADADRSGICFWRAPGTVVPMANGGVVVWYKELGLADATAGELIDAMASHPELIERPVVIWADRAVIARPPELLLPLLAIGQNPALP
jgi:ArsC family